MRGKYSPTVTAAYMKNQKWWDRFSESENGDWNQYDPDGYDSYGYDKNDVDRAGNNESDYYQADDYDVDPDYNSLYENALNEWTFDGTKPVRKTK
jgi:hypothetical protein